MSHFKLNASGRWLACLLGGLALALPAVLCAQPVGSDLTRENLAPADAGVAHGLPPYLEARAARFIDWLADGSMLVATRFGETEQIHHLRSPLGTREQLSFEPAGVLAAAAEPGSNDAFIELTPEAGGLTRALRLQRAGQTSTPVTDASLRAGAALWAHDGKRLVFSSSRSSTPAGGSGREREIDLIDTTAATPAVRVLAGGSGYRWHLFDISLDDQRVLLGRESAGAAADGGGGAAADLELFTAELAGGEPAAVALPRKPESKTDSKAATTVPAPLRARTARFAPDGRGLLWVGAGEGPGAADFEQLRYLEPTGAEARTLSSESEHEVELFDESPDGHYLAYTTDNGGLSRLVLVDQVRKLDLNPGAVPPGIISSLKFDASGKRLALTLESARAPPDVYVLEPDTQSMTRWTASELGPIDPLSLTEPALVRFPTWDRIEGQPRVLSAFVYRGRTPPAAATELVAPAAAVAAPAPTPAVPIAPVRGPRPVLILLRSGGGYQFRPGFDLLLQYLVNELGFVVVAPNVRGAAGYGRNFSELGLGALRDDAVRDVGSLLVWVGLQHELDFNHIVVMGEGYGSYLALAALGQYGDRLRGGIAAFAPHLGPISNMASIRRPVLLVQGRSDPDAPAYESEQLAARLRANGAPVQYLGAADEGAAFVRKSNRDAYCAAVANFLAQLVR